MNRLIARFTNNKCISTDMLGQDWEPALTELLRIQREHAPEREIEQIEMALYDPEYRDRWRFSYLPVDLKTWKPKERPSGPTQTNAGDPQAGQADRPATTDLHPTGVEALPDAPARRRGKRVLRDSPGDTERQQEGHAQHQTRRQKRPPAVKTKGAKA